MSHLTWVMMKASLFFVVNCQSALWIIKSLGSEAGCFLSLFRPRDPQPPTISREQEQRTQRSDAEVAPTFPRPREAAARVTRVRASLMMTTWCSGAPADPHVTNVTPVLVSDLILAQHIPAGCWFYWRIMNSSRSHKMMTIFIPCWLRVGHWASVALYKLWLFIRVSEQWAVRAHWYY